MEMGRLTEEFFRRIVDDPRIGPMHVSLYMALMYCSYLEGGGEEVNVFGKDVMPLAKFSSTATYHKHIRELAEYGYIEYEASFNMYLGSRVKFGGIRKEREKNKSASRYFLLPDKGDFTLMKVEEADRASFMEKYGDSIIDEGDSVQELLIRFSERKKG